jgi:phosphatidylinositol N-acetylglucosaminyltransferase subunit Q
MYALVTGEIVLPHYKKMFARVSSSFFKSLAYNVLTGQRYASNFSISFYIIVALPLMELLVILNRISSNLNTNMSPINPWMKLDFNGYWKLCNDSILSS